MALLVNSLAILQQEQSAQLAVCQKTNLDHFLPEHTVRILLFELNLMKLQLPELACASRVY